MPTSIVSREDINYLAQQSSGKLNMILAGMTALLNDTDNKVTLMENQTWFQRMCRTISGKNKMTKQEIQRNHDKISMYMTQAMTELFEQQCIDHEIMLSLGNQLNELYAEHLQLKQMLGSFVAKLNEKIESVDNFHLLNTEIEQGVYSECAPIVAICKILSQMDKRCMQDYRKMNILQRSMSTQNILDEAPITLSDYLMSIIEIPMDDVGTIYVELETIRGNFMANIILSMIENYHFLPDMARKLKSKQVVVESVIAAEQLEPSVALSIHDVFSEFVDSKLDMLDGLRPICEIQFDYKLQEAETLYLEYKLDEAFELFHTLAKKGNGRAMFFVGEYYAWGYGKIVKDSEKAKEWRIKGQEQGDILAMLNVAYTLPQSDNKRIDIFNEVFNPVLSLAENEDAIAQNELADMYRYGYGTEKNIDLAIRWYTKSAEKGYWKSQYKLGDYYESIEDYEKSIMWYQKAANVGHGEALGQIGNFLDWKGTLPKDYATANSWYHKAVEQDVDWAMYNLGLNYCSGTGCIQNYDTAVSLFKRAANIGHDGSAIKLGKMYESGEGVDLDYSEALKWYVVAADRENGEAQFQIGELYYFGRGVSQSYEDAVKWYRKAAENGNISAKRDLGHCYKTGQGVIQDLELAKKWYAAAAEDGNNYSATQVGILEADSWNYSEAVKWFRKAAENGYAEAQYRLGYCYENGYGLNKNYTEAYKWLSCASEQGNEDAKTILAERYHHDGRRRQEVHRCCRCGRKYTSGDGCVRCGNIGVVFEVEYI